MSRTTAKSLVTVLVAVALVGSAAAGTAIALGTTQEEPTPTEGTPTATPTEGTPTATPAEEPPGNETEGPSYVRVLHASPDAPPVDIYVENQTFLTNVSFGNVSNYTEVAPGTYNLTVTAAGDREAVVFDGTGTLEPGALTIAATGSIDPNASAGFELVGYADNAPRPAANESALSVVHLSPDAPAVDVTTTDGTVLADNTTYTNASNYTTVPAGNYTAQIRMATATNDGPVLTSVNVSLEGGSAYSALTLGYVIPDSSSQGFEVRLVEDATTVTENGTTTVRLPDDDGMGEPTPTPEPEPTATPEPEATPTPSSEATPTEATPAPGTEPGTTGTEATTTG